MRSNIYRYKGQDVFIWEIKPVGVEKVKVSYSYLRQGGEMGHRRFKTVWEDDFYETFTNSNKSVKIMWSDL